MTTKITTNKFEVSTDEAKFGLASLEFNGVDNTLVVTATENEFNFNENAFTVEGWVNLADATAEQMIVTNNNSGYADNDFYVKILENGQIETGVYGYTLQQYPQLQALYSDTLSLDGTAGTAYTVTASQTLEYTNPITVEAHVNFNTLPSDGNFMMFAGGPSNSEYVGIKNTAGTYTLEMAVTDGTGNYYRGVTIPTPSTGTWYHFAICNTDTGTFLFWNGTRYATGTSTGTWNSSYGWTNVDYLGGWVNTTYVLDGELEDFRLSTVERYSGATYTIPTSPFISDDDTEYLNHFNTTTAITGNTWTNLALTRTYSSSAPTAVAKFGNTSLQSTDPDVKTVGANINLELTDNFTAEGWVRFDSLPVGGTKFVLIQGGPNDKEDVSLLYDSVVSGNYRLKVQISDGNALGLGTYYEKAVDIPTPSLDTWYHFAVVKTDTGIDCFWNGTEYTTGQTVGSFSSDLGWSDIEKLASGYTPNTSHPSYPTLFDFNDDFHLEGYLDEVRISSNARYSGSSYTIPTSAFVTDANTLYLNHLEELDTIKLFVDGNEIITVPISDTDTFNFDNLYFGHYGNTLVVNGYIDEVRISDTNRYIGNFTPSGSAFTSDSNTLKLIDFEDINQLKTTTNLSVDLTQLNLGLSPSTTYRIELEEGIARFTGASRSLSQAVTNYATFTTNAATGQLISTVPTDTATNVTNGDTIVLNFDRYVRPGTATANLYSVVGNVDTLVHAFDTGNTSQVTYTGNVATLHTTGYLADTTNYRLDIPNDSIVDIDEFTISNLPDSVSFTTSTIS